MPTIYNKEEKIMKLRITAIIGLVAAVSLAFTACGSKEDGMVTTTTTVKAEVTTTSPEESTSEGMLEDLSEKVSDGMSEAKSNVEEMTE